MIRRASSGDYLGMKHLIVASLLAVMIGCDICQPIETTHDFAIYQQTDSWAFCCLSYSAEEPIVVQVSKAGSSSPIAMAVGYEAVCVTQDDGILAPAFLGPGNYVFEAAGADHCLQCLSESLDR